MTKKQNDTTEKKLPKSKRINDIEFPLSFKVLGKDDTHRFWFLPKNDPTPLGITKNEFNNSTFAVLDSDMSFWQDYTDILLEDNSSSIDREVIMFDLIRRAEKLNFDLQVMRGAGFWEDKGKILYNDGKALWVGTTKYSYTEFETEHVYVKNSSKRPSIFDCEESTVEDGKTLMDLFMCQKLDTNLNTILLMGWTAIAPFSSLLNWRPHIWITADPGVGKTFMLFDIIGKIFCTDSEGSCNGFAYASESGSTAAALKRQLGRIGFCAIIDELESNKTQKENIEKILELAHKSASSKNGITDLVGQNGKIESYIVRQAFLMGSINTTSLQKAKRDRIIFMELNGDEQIRKEKIRQTNTILKTKFLDNNPQRFIRRMYNRLDQFFSNLEIIRIKMMEIGEINQREIDMYAPCFAGVSVLLSDEVMGENDADHFISSILNKKKNEETETDHDNFFDILFQSTIELQNDIRREKTTVGTIMTLTAHQEMYNKEVVDALANIGIKIDGTIKQVGDKKIGVGFLWISTNSIFIKKQLENEEIFSGGYAKLMRRHKCFCKEKNNNSYKTYMGGVTKNCLKFSLKSLTENYFNGVIEKDFLDQIKEIPF